MPVKPVVRTRRQRVIFPTSQSSTPARSLRSSITSFESLSEVSLPKATQPGAVYVGIVKHVHHHYTKKSKPKADVQPKKSTNKNTADLDGKSFWVQQGERLANTLQPAAKILLAVLVFCASRVSLGFGVRLNG